MVAFTLIAVFVVSFAIFWWLTKSVNNESGKYKPIPGPIGIPVFGHLFFMGTQMHVAFAKWARKYGKIFQIRLGNRNVVVLSDVKWVKEAFAMEEFAGREAFEEFQMYDNESLGIASIQGEFWEVTRRFVLRNLRDFGFGKSSMEGLITEEVKLTIEYLKRSPDRRIRDLKKVVQVAVVNSLWLVVGSKRFDQDDPQIHDMMDKLHETLQEFMKKAIMVFVPWTRHFFPFYSKFHKEKEEGKKFYIDIVNQHRETLVDDAPRDFVDAFLLEMKAQKDNPSSVFYGDKAERHLHALLADLFFGGSDTSSITISWLILYLTKFPLVQKKLQDEIHAITDDTRHVTLKDREKMNYTLAVIEETLRHSSIGGAGFQHCALKGREFKGYYIPKGSWIFPNTHFLHHNKEVWGDPENFRPERFLDANGKFVKNENALPFSSGRRQCPGEPLARNTVFLFVTNIFQRFYISLDPNEPEATLEPEVGFNISPHPYSVVLRDRTKDLID